jgi:inner membrane protein involved in colicin E2 resistance
MTMRAILVAVLVLLLMIPLMMVQDLIMRARIPQG